MRRPSRTSSRHAPRQHSRLARLLRAGTSRVKPLREPPGGRPVLSAPLSRVRIRVGGIPASKARDVVKVAVLPLSASASDVTLEVSIDADGPARVVLVDLGHGHDVETEVQLAIAGAGEPVAHHVTGGHFDGGGAGVAGECGGRAESSDGPDGRGSFLRSARRPSASRSRWSRRR